MKKLLSLLAFCLTTFMTSDLMAKTLVAYFSVTGNTKQVAEKLANAINADLFEIKPETEYTDIDINWRDETSRASIEMNDEFARPVIANTIEDINQYDTIFVGFPIWFGREPAIINTFMESYNLDGKTIIPFATSGSSSIGDSGANMQALAPNATVLTGQRFSTDISEQELKAWAESQM